MTFIEKRGCRVRSLSVNTPSPTAQRCTAGAPDGPQGYETQETTEINEAGRADKLGRTQSILSLRSLKSLVTEEICGRFGPFDGSTTAYRLP